MSRRKKSQQIFWRRWRSLVLLAGFAVAGGALEARQMISTAVDLSQPT